ncbi:mechanosensitive ion channel protein 8 [Rosa chinensis]|uniref:mechanosensitive ion channel protein 8 n=1 Tax=Rosa chinensis TaxID=74649 RepID=UPI000D086EB3|nr:mechanosensitive ion channel protein 8 [Rosa chinensis]
MERFGGLSLRPGYAFYARASSLPSRYSQWLSRIWFEAVEFAYSKDLVSGLFWLGGDFVQEFPRKRFIRVLREMNLWKLILWKWEVLILVSICGRLVSGWLRIMVFFVERNSSCEGTVIFCLWDQEGCLELYLAWPYLMGWHFGLIKKGEKETNGRIQTKKKNTLY